MSKKIEVKLGLEKLLTGADVSIRGNRVGLICNPASVNGDFQHAADLFHASKFLNLVSLFGPQHGIRGDVQDNMIETAHGIDPETGLPVYSLYSETRIPTEEMLSNLDALVFDLQDVGCRVYTFIYTMANAMRACAGYGVKFVVLDRPNPIAGVDVEGNVLEVGHESFVGLFPIPMRHGMTVGELALLFNKEFNINCELEVVKMEGWSRENYFDETNAPWVMPSPNMPTVDTAVVFPATVIFEGTQVSEGRGTTRPFEIIGAPYINGKEFASRLNSIGLPGVIFRPIGFMPTFQKHAGKQCGGVFLHVVDRAKFQSVKTGIAMLRTIIEMYPNDFKWKEPPYEYVYDRNPFDVIQGTIETRRQIEFGLDLDSIVDSWQKPIEDFRKLRKQYLLY